MSQMGFFDFANRYAGLDAKNDPLPKLNTALPWEDYKNHINVDRHHKLVRCYKATDASFHDSQVIEDILDADNT